MMRSIDRRQLLAIVVAILCLTALPGSAASASNTLDVGSQHATDTELANAKTLENLAVSGSGSDAYVEVNDGVLDDIEDGDIAEYSGDTGPFSAQSDTVFEGSYALQANDTGQHDAITDTEVTTSTGNNYTVRMRLDADSDMEWLFGVQSETGAASLNAYGIELSSRDDVVRLNEWNDGSQSVEKSQSVTINGSEWYRVELNWQSDGTQVVTVYDSNGAEIAQMSRTDTTHSSGGHGWSSFYGASYADLAEGEGGLPATYVSANHSVSKADEAAINITQVTNASATLRADYWDGSQWIKANETTVTTAANHSLGLPDVSSDKWRVNVTFEQTGDRPEAQMADETILFSSRHPQVDNGSASPSGGETESETPVQLSIDVSDEDFSTAQGDEVSVEFRDASDDSVIGTDTLSSNGTATVEWDNVVGGENDWYAVAEDDYGGSTQSDTFTFSAPDKLRIYNESAPTELVDNVTVELRFYYDDDEEIVERETTNGIINMTGLDPSQPFVVVAEADGYLPRRIYVTSLTESQEVFLLPEDVNYVEPTFELEDFTGDYPKEDSVLIVQRSLNSSWKTVQGDFFGATGQWTAQLEYNERHQLILLNTETGEREPLGTFTPTTSGAQTVQVTAGDTILLAESGPMVFASPSVGSVPAEETSVDLELDPRDDEITSWNVSVVFQNETTDETLYEESFDSSGGSASPDLNLTDRGDGSIIVAVQWETAENVTGGKVLEFSVRRVFENDYSVFAITQRFGDQFPDRTAGGVTTFLAVLGTVLITTAVASKAPISTEVNGLVAVASVCGFWIIGWLPFSLVFATGTAWAAFATLRRGI